MTPVEWFLLSLLLQITGFEVWATLTGNLTISMWWWGVDADHVWARIPLIAAWLVLAYHLHLFRTPKA